MVVSQGKAAGLRLDPQRSAAKRASTEARTAAALNSTPQHVAALGPVCCAPQYDRGENGLTAGGRGQTRRSGAGRLIQV
jgi:hypothetical protein